MPYVAADFLLPDFRGLKTWLSRGAQRGRIAMPRRCSTLSQEDARRVARANGLARPPINENRYRPTRGYLEEAKPIATEREPSPEEQWRAQEALLKLARLIGRQIAREEFTKHPRPARGPKDTES